jgi:hypothetical protein
MKTYDKKMTHNKKRMKLIGSAQQGGDKIHNKEVIELTTSAQ